MPELKVDEEMLNIALSNAKVSENEYHVGQEFSIFCPIEANKWAFDHGCYILNEPDEHGIPHFTICRKNVEELAEDARDDRDEKLYETDWMVLPDSPLTDEQRIAICKYRQALRDITKKPGFPGKIVWPEMPDLKKIKKFKIIK